MKTQRRFTLPEFSEWKQIIGPSSRCPVNAIDRILVSQKHIRRCLPHHLHHLQQVQTGPAQTLGHRKQQAGVWRRAVEDDVRRIGLFVLLVHFDLFCERSSSSCSLTPPELWFPVGVCNLQLLPEPQTQSTGQFKLDQHLREQNTPAAAVCSETTICSRTIHRIQPRTAQKLLIVYTWFTLHWTGLTPVVIFVSCFISFRPFLKWFYVVLSW